MADLSIQASFNTGEWAPTLNARVDIAKYRSAAALLENFFVDYRGGASTRPGTEYILQAYKSSSAVRLIPFQVDFYTGYAMEFGDYYIRFFHNGAPVLETALNITGATKANPCVVSVTNSYAAGDWVYITDVSGMTQLNGNYYSVSAATAGTITLADLNGAAINSSAYGAWTSGGTVARVYTLPSPYAAADLALVKYAQNANIMVFCHPDYVPYILTYTSAASWTINQISIGSTVGIPTGVTITTTLAAGSVNYSYLVTAVDIDGQESGPSTPGALASKQDLRTVAGTNHIAWTAVSGASSYNVYKANISYFGVVSTGSPYGFIGNTTGVTFDDSNISADYTQTPPVARNPFQGAGVQSVTVTANGNYATVPTATVDAAPAGGATATVSPILQIVSSSLAAAGLGLAAGTIVTGSVSSFGGASIRIDTVNGAGSILTYTIINPGTFLSGSPSTTFVILGPGNAQITLTWGVTIVNVVSQGAGYTSVPAITFSSGAAAATAVLASTSAGNPAVPGFFQQRLVLASLPQAPQSFYMSQPGNYYNFNISNPSLSTDAITETLVSGQLNTIKAMIPQTTGLLMFTDKYSFLINGGSNGSGISPSAIVANAQSFNGISDVPPIIANYDVLYVQAKGSVVRDSAFNIYQNVYTGTDISLLSSHLFYGYSILEWAFAEEPFKLIQCIRDDGVLLTLTFLKEQEFIGWAHSITDGDFKSVTVVTEAVTNSLANDATYFVIERVVNGNTVKYIERLANRQFPNGVEDAWCVDAGIQYDGTPTTSFMGAQHLAGMTCTGLADGVIIPSFTMPTDGNFTLTTAASKVTVGLAFTCKLQTLAIELGEPTAQGKVKKINNVDVRVADTLGLEIGQDFDHLTPMKDLVRGNVSSMLTGQQTQVVSDLYTGDARTWLSPAYTVPGQYCIQQSNPYPASILGVIPNITVGDTR